MSLNEFYTYAYLRLDGTPYYIGKGKGNRAFRKRRGFNPPKDTSRILILKKDLTEEDAFKHEIYMIALYGRKELGPGILHNRTNGGDGPSGLIQSEESRKKISEAIKGEKNPNFGKTPSEETRRKNMEEKLSKNVSTILIDALFMPIKKVNYKTKLIHDTKGNIKESLIFEIWTNGSITPKRSLLEAIKILMNLLYPLFITPSFLSLSSSLSKKFFEKLAEED